MPWNPVWPIGNLSVKANETPGTQNTAYIETTMGNTAVGTQDDTTRDHFWNVGSFEDGRHRYVCSPAFTIGGNPADPVIGDQMDGVSYIRFKTAAESTAQQDVQPFFQNATSIMQLLGMRACIVFNFNGAITSTVYAHNVDSLSRTATGKYTLNFTTALPSINYLVLGAAIRNSSSTSDELMFMMQGSQTVTNVKDVGSCKFQFQSTSGTLRDPLQAWVICFGG